MSIFWIGGPEGIIVPMNEIKTTEEDRYFLPGVIHGGEDYLIQVYGWNAGEGPEGERIGARYLFATQLLEWAAKATQENGSLNEEAMTELINEHSEEFVVDNDGTGDFVTINSVWDKALPLTYTDVLAWAQYTANKEKLNAAPDKALSILDHAEASDGEFIYTVSLQPGFAVDVKVCPENGLTYVMQNYDGSMVHGESTCDLTFPNYPIDDAAIVGFVKEAHAQILSNNTLVPLEEMNTQSLISRMKVLMGDMLDNKGYRVTEEKLSALWEIYEDCQEWSEEGEMLTGLTFDEVADFVKHSKSVDEVFPFAEEANSRKYIPCVYVSVWDGTKYELSFPAKYDPETHKVFDIQLSAEDLADCNVLCGEFVVLEGKRFFLGEPSADGARPVEAALSAPEAKRDMDVSKKPSLMDKIASASARSGSASEPKDKKEPQPER